MTNNKDQLGEGWYEFIRLPAATTHIAHISESGYIYTPERGVNDADFMIAQIKGDVRKLIREDLAVSDANVIIDELTEAIRFTAEYLGRDWLPAIEGWSWYDALKKYAPEKLNQLSDESDSNLVKHAKKELALINEEQSVIDGYIRIIKAFSDMGHSGGSASVAIQVIHELLQFNNLAPLTDDPDEWMYHGSELWDGVTGVWQNKRNSKMFSNDGGSTFYNVNENDRGKKYVSKVVSKTDGK